MPIGDAVLCEEKDLDTVFPQYVTFTVPTKPGLGLAVMHKNMALLKSWITSRYEDHNGNMRCHVKVYEVIKGKAHLLYDLPQGSVKKESDLWAKKPSQRAIVVDEDEVAAALESITRSMS